jgi:ubiquinone/menaquinone biosynthesis C-methylase UbiE
VAPPRWLPDELARAGPEHLDPAYAARYDRKTQPHFDPTEEIAFLRELGLDETHTLVDLGAGTGAVALAAARVCRRVVAVDVSPAMLAVAREEADRRGVRNVELVRQGFLTYEHAGEPADFVYTRNALHHLPDFWKAIALERVRSFLRPGGILRLRDLVFAFEPGEAGGAIETWLAGAPEDAAEGWTRSELEEHVREEHSTFTWLLEPMLERTGFAIRDADYRGTTYAAYVCVHRERD